MYARYKIGLGGTFPGKQCPQLLFKDYSGPNLNHPAVNGTMVPSIVIVDSGVTLTPDEVWVKKINNLLYDPSYQAFIAAMAKTQMLKGHKVLIIADRVEFLQKVQELIGNECVCITGGSGFEERKALKEQIESGEKSCVAGSRQIFSEGISVNPLSCLILAAPISAPAGADGLLEQLVGRIMRQSKNKLHPVVLDVNFNGIADKKQNKERLAFYTRKGWEVSKL